MTTVRTLKSSVQCYMELDSSESHITFKGNHEPYGVPSPTDPQGKGVTRGGGVMCTVLANKIMRTYMLLIEN